MSIIKALELIGSNGTLTQKGNDILNRYSKEAFEAGYIKHAPRKLMAWELTAKGKALLSSARTGIPLPRSMK